MYTFVRPRLLESMKMQEKKSGKIVGQSMSLIYGLWFNSQVIDQAHSLGVLGENLLKFRGSLQEEFTVYK